MQQPEISVIIPAYMEEKRIGSAISAFSGYLDKVHPNSELIVVCDGCTDKTADVVRASFVAEHCLLRVIELATNQGKGAAVRAGMLSANGMVLIFTDADLAFSPETIEPFLEELRAGADIVVAQRKKETRYPGMGRRFVAVASRAIVGNFIFPGIRDTQAGFKAFTRHSGRFLFSRAKIRRFLFDLEILMMARKKGFKIQKVYVDWQDVPGSTVRLYVDSSRSLRDLVLILFYIICGFYNLNGPDVLD